jgi:hypothetical protein
LEGAAVVGGACAAAARKFVAAVDQTLNGAGDSEVGKTDHHNHHDCLSEEW